MKNIKTTKDLENYNIKNAENKVWSHSLNMTEMYNFSKLIRKNQSAEICVTKDVEAGKFLSSFDGIGFYIKGKVTAMFSRDVDSWISRTGTRSFFNVIEKYLVEDYNNLKAENKENDPGTKYTESFLIPTEIVGAWTNNKKYTKEALMKLIKSEIGMELPITVIS